ncbi:GAF domain-containing sensor histidine kinase [Aliidiomarina maris]|nr:GAF domain-containing sensor histidine kinase [Aliidiomarina maris]RAJ99235.1 GAF domain-containing protein [Aliidiomarina maris]
MQQPGTPANEAQRLAHLTALKVLDTSPEERFDNITKLAAEMFSVPVALISLVDDKRQWFKSSCGLDIKETSREISFCGHVVEQGDMMVIQDTTKDPRFTGNPLTETTEQPVIFYAGAPIKAQGDLVLGTLCLIDHSPRELSDSQQQQLGRLARIVEDELELRQLVVRAKNAEKRLAQKQQHLEQRNHKLMQLIERFKTTRSRLISAEKLATLGLLAAGVGKEAGKAINISRKHLLEAHKLAGNEKCAGLISQSMSCQDDLRRMVDALSDTTETAGNNELAETDLNDTVRHCRNVLLSRFDNKVRFVFEPVADLPKVRVVESQIFMALLNVLVNAAESSAGKVSVKVALLTKDDHVQIRVQDNGDGMSDETVQRATEAFYSEGKDSLHFGLGLSIATGIVRDHSGALKVRSEQGKGTLVVIALPLAQPAQTTTELEQGQVGAD